LLELAIAGNRIERNRIRVIDFQNAIIDDAATIEPFVPPLPRLRVPTKFAAMPLVPVALSVHSRPK
jgi:hypothetical protein